MKAKLEEKIKKEIEELSPEQLQEVLTYIKHPHKVSRKIHALDFNDLKVKIGIISDTHIGHKLYRYDVLRHAAQEFTKDKVDFVIHCGDILEGVSGRDGHMYELAQIGYESQMKYALEELEIIKQPIYGITASNSHDGWYNSKENAGVDVGSRLEKELKNFKFLGYDEADLKLDNGLIIRLSHPGGGTAYAISYQLQKYINAISGGVKPNLLFQGHYHKAEYLFYRNVHAFDAGCLCFTKNTGITTPEGKKHIVNIKEGDLVLTHKNRYKKVLHKYKRKYEGKLIKIYFGRKDSDFSRITPTPEHPILIERNGKTFFEKAQNVITDDWIVVVSSKCKFCDCNIPYYNKMCIRCNPMNDDINRLKISNIKGTSIRKYEQVGSAWKHLNKDILPYCEKLNNEGWKAVPVGAGTIPDIVAFKDGKIHIFEIESSRGLKLKRKQDKYNNSPILKYVNKINWVDCYASKNRGDRREYKEYVEGFVKVKVLKVEEYASPKRNTRNVYNLEVEEDNTYVAGNVVVHNCDQTIFMRKKQTPAMVGYWIVTCDVGKSGGVNSITPKFRPYYE